MVRIRVRKISYTPWDWSKYFIWDGYINTPQGKFIYKIISEPVQTLPQ